jgi:hypothetical protein
MRSIALTPTSKQTKQQHALGDTKGENWDSCSVAKAERGVLENCVMDLENPDSIAGVATHWWHRAHDRRVG